MADSRIDELRGRLERDPGSRLFAQLAEELRKEGELEEAIGIARAGLERHANYLSARLTLGRALLDSGDPGAARVELEAAVQGAPDNILASRLLGEALETLGDLGSALDQYGRTLQMAPDDGHVKSRIGAIQERLGAPADAGGRSATTDRTEAMEALDGTEDEDEEEEEKEEEEEEEEDLPPTIRIRMPGELPRPGRAPLPPVPEAPPGAEATAPRPVETESDGSGPRLPGTLPTAGVEDAPVGERVIVRPEPHHTAREPITAAPSEPGPTEASPAPALPMDVAPVDRVRTDEAPTEAPRAAEQPPAAASDLAPTPPESRAAEVGSEDQGVPPSLALGMAPPLAQEPVDSAGPGGEMAGGPAAAAPEGARAPGAVRGTGAAAPPLSSATLAELYFQQGLLERAVEVYTQVLDEEPDNQGARDRLAAIETLVSEGASELSTPASDGETDTAARRRALQRTIQRLEALLEVVRRR